MGPLSWLRARLAGEVQEPFTRPKPPGLWHRDSLPVALTEAESIATTFLLDKQQQPDASPATNEPEQDEELLPMANRARMQLEKKLYPGAETWAPDEERLFEVLYLREELAILPSHWNLDFCGVPMATSVFASSEEVTPIVFAHSTEREFHATTVVSRLIEMTSDVRATSQSGFRKRVPNIIKDGLDQLISWSALDGGYANLKTVPNIFVEIVDLGDKRGDKKDDKLDHITEYMQTRMKNLAQLQREFYKSDRSPDFWTDTSPRLMNSKLTIVALQAAITRRKLFQKVSGDDGDESNGVGEREESVDIGSDLGTPTPVVPSIEIIPPSEGSASRKRPRPDENLLGAEQRRRETKRLKPARTEVEGEATEPDNPDRVERERSDSAERAVAPSSGPKTPQRARRRDSLDVNPGRDRRTKPPVVYGLFILNTSVFVLTVDSAKGRKAYVSYLVDVDFIDSHQSVWNALTVALTACLARDSMRTRLDEFENMEEEVDSDPDA